MRLEALLLCSPSPVVALEIRSAAAYSRLRSGRAGLGDGKRVEVHRLLGDGHGGRERTLRPLLYR